MERIGVPANSRRQQSSDEVPLRVREPTPPSCLARLPNKTRGRRRGCRRAATTLVTSGRFQQLALSFAPRVEASGRRFDTYVARSSPNPPVAIQRAAHSSDLLFLQPGVFRWAIEAHGAFEMDEATAN